MLRAPSSNEVGLPVETPGLGLRCGRRHYSPKLPVGQSNVAGSGYVTRNLTAIFGLPYQRLTLTPLDAFNCRPHPDKGDVDRLRGTCSAFGNNLRRGRIFRHADDLVFAPKCRCLGHYSVVTNH